tara:strand:+ start:292 stop:429 length:138 start_codon:yes stop_codon:yes gene_type:complete
MAKDINKEIDFVIDFYNKCEKRIQRSRDIDLTYVGKYTDVYKVNM